MLKKTAKIIFIIGIISSLIMALDSYINALIPGFCNPFIFFIALFGPAAGLGLLIYADPIFRSNLLMRPVNFKLWADMLIVTIVILALGAVIFYWGIDDPTGNMEAGSVFWGYPFPWLKTGPFYAGYGGEMVRSQGGYLYIFGKAQGYRNPTIMAEGLIIDLPYLFIVSAALVYFLDERQKT